MAAKQQEATTGWVLPPKPIGGLDHLGVQAPCIALYAQLLPGITNVTDRARYYSFHPWLLRHFDRRYGEKRQSSDELSRVLRRAECLFALIAIRHGRKAEDQDPGRHDAAVVGRQELQKAEQEISNADLNLGDFAGLDGPDTPRRYFKNRLGGLGQYYFGPLRDLRVLGTIGEGRAAIPGYDKVLGAALADALDGGVDADQFFTVLEAPAVRSSDLDDLAAFCPCRLADNGPEREALRDLFLGRSPRCLVDGGERRRATLGLLLALIDRGAARHPELAFENVFRIACYTDVLPGGGQIGLPAAVADAARGWATYQRNELLSVALQGLFAAVLEAIVTQHDGYIASSAEAGPVARSLCAALGAGLLDESLSAVTDRLGAELPALGEWEHEEHEIQLGWRCQAAFAAHQPDELAVASVKLLLALATRGLPAYPYADFTLDPDYFAPQELHLLSFKHHLQASWGGMTVGAWVSWLGVHWGVERHLRVALRKLRTQRQDTFRVRPLEHALQVVDVPEPVFTVPRIGRAVQILRDLALIDAVADGYDLTAAGHAALEAIRG